MLRTNSGISLIESLISVLILTIVVAGGMAFYFNAAQLTSLRLHKQLALQTASSKLEEFKDSNYATLVQGITQADVTIGELEAKVSGGLGMTTIITDRDDNPPSGTDYKEISVSVVWQEPSRNLSQKEKVELTTFVAP